MTIEASMSALFYAAILAKLLSIPAFLIAGVKIVHAITPGPICPACLDGSHDELAEITEKDYRCSCSCHEGRAK